MDFYTGGGILSSTWAMEDICILARQSVISTFPLPLIVASHSTTHAGLEGPPGGPGDVSSCVFQLQRVAS